jgi:hypothetical protein
MSSIPQFVSNNLHHVSGGISQLAQVYHQVQLNQQFEAHLTQA